MSKLKIKDLNNIANVYQVPTTGTGATLSGSLEGDVIVIDGSSAGYTIKASGSKVTIAGINDFGKKFSVTVTFDKSKAAVAQTAKFAFADGTVELAYNPATKLVTSAGAAVGKSVVGVSTLSIDNTITSDAFDGTATVGGSAPVLGQAFTLTTGLDNVQGSVGNDTIDARSELDATVLDQFDVVSGGQGRDTLITDSDVDLRGVTGVEILATSAGFTTLGAAAVAAGIDTVSLRGSSQGVDLTEFAAAVTVNGNASNETVGVNLKAAGNKTLNLGAGSDTVAVEATGEETAADAGSIEVRFESAKVGDGTNNNVSIIGSASTATVNDEGTVIVARTDSSETSQANLFKVQGINADGTVAANQNRGNFSYVVLGTEADNDFDTEDFGPETDDIGNVYINAGMGDDTLSATAAAGQRHFLVGGAGDDEISTLTMKSDSQAVEAGTIVVLAGAGDDEVTVGGQRQTGTEIVNGPSGSGSISIPTFETTASSGIETIDLGTGNDKLTVLGELNVNKAGASSFAGGEGTDTLVAGINVLKQVQAPVEGEAYTVSGFEAVTLALPTAFGREDAGRDLVLANIQKGLATVNAATDISNTNIVFDVSSVTINLEAGFANGSGSRVNAEIAGEGTNDTLTINNAVNALLAPQTGKVVAANAFDSAVIEVDGIENIVLNGTGLPRNATSTIVPEATTQTVRFVGHVDFEDEGTLLKTVTLTGSNSFDLEDVGATTVNASGLTGNAGLFMNTLGDVRSTTAVTQTITGSANKDEVFVNSNEPGEDSVPVAVNINLGAGDDQVELSAFASESKLAASTIAGGAGRDTFAINSAFSGGALNGVSGFEVLSVGSSRGDYTQDMLQFVNNATFNTIRMSDVEDGDRVTLNNVSNTVTKLEIFDNEGDIAINRLIDNTSNAITIETRAATAKAGYGAFVSDILLNDEETITIDTGARVLREGVASTNANLLNPDSYNYSDFDVEDISATDLTTLVLKGAGDIDIREIALGDTKRVVTVNASAMTGHFEFYADSDTNASLNVTGSSGENDIEGTSNNDVITVVTNADDNNIEGNGGNDTISFTGNGLGNYLDGEDGNDTITVTANRNALNVDNRIQVEIDGGSGNDSITVTGTASVDIEGGSGADVIVGGSGNDIIAGDRDADMLTGGAGKDTFVFEAGDSTARAGLFDTITDFSVANDSIAVSNEIVSVGGNETATNEAALLDLLARNDGLQLPTNAATLFVVGNDGYLFIDANGNGLFDVTNARDSMGLEESAPEVENPTFDVLVKLVGVTDINDINFVGSGNTVEL